MSMFCYQCEQTSKGAGCTLKGVCGKDPETATLQDLLVHVTKGISQYAHRARLQGRFDAALDHFVIEALFTTVTNVNFDPETISVMIRSGSELREKARQLLLNGAEEGGDIPSGPAQFDIGETMEEQLVQGRRLALGEKLGLRGPDVSGLQELVLYGLKGMAAYMEHARVLGREDDTLYAFMHKALSRLADNPTDVDELTTLALKTGEVNLRVMELLDEANTGTYGHPEPTKVRTTPVKGKCILISGHDLLDMYKLLEQTAGKGINIYTHGEMLPGHGYPELKKYTHLVGNYGGAWQDQAKEFDKFPGAILMTTNCIQQPKESYKNRIYTSGLVQWPGVHHIDDHDFTPVINAALEAEGFTEDAEEAYTMTGFGHNAVLNVADKVIDAVKSGAIRKFFLIGGCDGAKSGRNYYTDLATELPDDTVIMTLACGKFRFNKLEFGDIEGIPRMLDMGQCNDAYSAIQVALALANAFECGVNDLPLSLVLSWYEQKAVCILLTLLHLGIKDMRLGPSLPAFIGPNVLNVLVEQFGLKPITTVEEDMAAMLPT